MVCFASSFLLDYGCLGGVPVVDGILGSFLVAVFFFFSFFLGLLSPILNTSFEKF